MEARSDDTDRFSDSEASNVDEIEEAAALAEAELLQQELGQTSCDLCGCSLGAHPIRLVTCRHALCGTCALRSVFVFCECPVCGRTVERGGKRAVGMPQGDAQSVTAQQQVDEAAAFDDESRMAKAKTMAKEALLLEYGNTASAKGAKTSFKTYARVVAGRGSIKKVSFNINPSFDRQTEVVEHANDSHLGFTFEYAMARPYPCHLKVEFAKDVPPLTIEYRVRTLEDFQGMPCFSRRVAIDMPIKLRGKRQTPLVVNAEESPCSVWITRSGEVCKVLRT